LHLQPTSQTVRMADIAAALSHALDLTEGQPTGHCLRCCWIGVHIGRGLGMSDAELSDLYYAIMLKDLGCSSNAARICSHYLTDDLSFKRDFKQIDGSLPQALRFILEHAGLQAGMAERFRTLYKVLSSGGELAKDLIETRCTRGADIADMLRFGPAVQQTIRCLDEHWDGTGLPNRISGKLIPLYSQIALLSQVADVFHTIGGRELAVREVLNRSGTWFDPELVDSFRSVEADEAIWSGLANPDLDIEVINLQPVSIDREVDENMLDDFAEAFAKVVDAKSPFTAGHSERVTVYTDLIAAHMGCAPDRRRWLRRAALLHDIGKLGVSNSILDKPGKLDEDEFATIKMHPVHSEQILNRSKAFADLAPIAAGHHERLDGKGYPYGLAAGQIDNETRIVTVADIFDALTADRPYRKAMPEAKALSIMDEMVGTAIDPDCYQALKNCLSELEVTAA
jgi:HD-GYP domain-containing protein (c-di-GMP phosphodiesterase class II)